MKSNFIFVNQPPPPKKNGCGVEEERQRKVSMVDQQERWAAQCKATAEVGDAVAMYRSMDQDYVSTHVLEAVEDAWEWEERCGGEEQCGTKERSRRN